MTAKELAKALDGREICYEINEQKGGINNA